MNNRLQQFLNAEDITQAQLADTLGVARASVSHILAGRNKPGFDFMERISRNYPALNLEWLISGRGRMYKASQNAAPALPQTVSPAQGEPAAPLPAPDPVSPVVPISEIKDEFTGSLFVDEDISSNTLDKKSVFRSSKPSVRIPASGGRISKIIVLFADGTFQEFRQG